MKNKKNLQMRLLIAGALMLAVLPSELCFARLNYTNQKKEEVSQTVKQPTIYGIASISKVFTSAAVMQLAEQGRLDLDTPLIQYISDFEMEDERYTQITPRMLLDHSSGLMGTASHNTVLLGRHSGITQDAFLKGLRNQRLKADPGAFSVYSNDSFTLAEILVERVSSMSFTQYIEQNICAKLGMNDTYTPVSRFDRSMQAEVYYNNKNMEFPPEYTNEVGAGGILSTAEDLCRFGQIFTEQGTTVLSRNSVKEMEIPQTNNPFFDLDGEGLSKYGLGWDTVLASPFDKYGIKALRKGGDTGFYHGSLTVLPKENMTAAVLSSGGSSIFDQLLVDEILLGALQQDGKAVEASDGGLPQVLENTDLSIFKNYEGYYISQGMLKVRFQDGVLYISTLDQKRDVTQEYLPAEGGVFLSANGDYISNSGELVSAEGGVRGKTVISFKDGENGEKYICVSSSVFYPGVGEGVLTVPYAQKVEEQTVPLQVRTAWEARDGKKYYKIDEMPASIGYLNPVTTVHMPKEGSGYFRNAKIVDEEHASAFLEIPIMLGRDLLDFHFYSADGKEYLDINNGGDDEVCLNSRYISGDSIDKLPGRKFSFTLDEGESTRWYQIPKDLSGQEVNIKLPENTAFFAYDSNDRLTSSSLAVNGFETLRFPRDGKIVFAGSEGDTFAME